MKLKMYMIYDSKIEAYDRPFFAQTNGEAERIIYEAMQDNRSNVSKYPADYNLFYAGNFDGFKGFVESTPLVNMGTLLEIAVRWNRASESVRQQLKAIGGENNEVSDES